MRTTRIAIPLFHTRIAPRFDCTTRFWVVSVTGEKTDKQVMAWDTLSLHQRINALADLDIRVLICGGLDRMSAGLLRGVSGLDVYPWVTGEAEDALACYLRGELESHLMIQKGGQCRGRWQFRPDHHEGHGGRVGRGFGHGFGCAGKTCSAAGGGRQKQKGRRR